MEKKHGFSYNDTDDSLIVSNRSENEIVKENFEVGDIIFSLTGKGKIISIEIREFSSFLEACNMPIEIAKNMDNVELKIIPKKETIFLLIKIVYNNKGSIISKEIPLVMPLNSINKESQS